MPGTCSCGACLPCVTWGRDAALNRIDRALHVLDTGKHFVPIRVRAILAGEATGKDTVPMVRAEVADDLRTRIAELAAGVSEWKARAESRQTEIERQMAERQNEWQGKQREATAYECELSGLRERLQKADAELKTIRYERGQLRAGLAEALTERDLERQRAAQAEESRDEWAAVALLGPEDTLPEDAERNLRELLERRYALECEREALADELRRANLSWAESREKALEEAAGAIRQGLAELAKMPTPTKGHEVLAELQRNLLEKCVAEIEALKPRPRRGDE